MQSFRSPWRTIPTFILVIAFNLIAASPLAAQARVIYVNHAAVGANDGTSWSDAFTSLHSAIAVTTQPDDQIWVAQGIYTTSLINARNERFEILAPMEIYGGFNGTETTLGQQDPNAHHTVLSGEIGGPSSTDNAINVVVVDQASPHPVLLDGLRIEDAYEPGVISGALYGVTGDTLLRRCSFTRNAGVAVYFLDTGTSRTLWIEECSFVQNGPLLAGGGGSAVAAGDHITILDSEFLQNEAEITGGGLTVVDGATVARCTFRGNRARHGGAVRIGNTPLPGATLYRFLDCVFEANESEGRGGALDVDGQPTTGHVQFRDCYFLGNESVNGSGGAIYASHLRFGGNSWPPIDIDRCEFRENSCDGSGSRNSDEGGGALFGRFRGISNSLFVGNRTRAGWGGAICTPLDGPSWETDIVHCTIVGNHSYMGGGGVFTGQYKRLRLAGCILWGNTAAHYGGPLERQQIGHGYLGKTHVQFSAIEGMQHLDGRGNTGAYPLFVNPAAGDFRLQPGSPLIDRGFPLLGLLLPTLTQDLDGNVRIQGTRADMGAYEVR